MMMLLGQLENWKRWVGNEIEGRTIGIIGFGRIGQMHAENINKNKDLRLLYVYDFLSMWMFLVEFFRFNI